MYAYKPTLMEGANCGPTVLSAILECHITRAMSYLEEHNEGGWHCYTNVGHLRNVIKALGGTFKKNNDVVLEWGIDSMDRMKLIACFIQIKGPWMGKGWRNEYNHTHWALFQYGQCMDVNNPAIGDLITWIPTEEWKRDTLPRIIASYEGGNGWSLRGAYSAEVSL